jgi:hypothetical protein
MPQQPRKCFNLVLLYNHAPEIKHDIIRDIICKQHLKICVISYINEKDYPYCDIVVDDIIISVIDNKEIVAIPLNTYLRVFHG